MRSTSEIEHLQFLSRPLSRASASEGFHPFPMSCPNRLWYPIPALILVSWNWPKRKVSKKPFNNKTIYKFFCATRTVFTSYSLLVIGNSAILQKWIQRLVCFAWYDLDRGDRQNSWARALCRGAGSRGWWCRTRSTSTRTAASAARRGAIQ